jgi:WS/DGAT/MGAT family acyltransferase
MDRLTPLAVAFVDAEDADPKASMAMGSISVFAGPAPPFEDFLGAIEGRLPLLPRYRQKMRTVPFNLAPPVWVDDHDFDVRWHIRNTALPAPGGPAEIGRLMSRVMTQRMDRGRPLWECWFCEGLAEGRWGMLLKLHHSMADGVSGSDMYRLILDATAEPGPPAADDWRPAPPSSTLSFTARAVWDLTRAPVVGVRALGEAARSPRQLARRSGQIAKGWLSMSGALRPLDRSSLTGSLDGSRRYAWTAVSLADIATVRGRFGGTLNDVAVTAVTGGFRRLLLSRGETPTAHTLRSLVPVSTREAGAESVPDNRVSLMLPYLPVDLAEPRDRFAAIHSSLRALRSAAEYAPYPPVSLGIRLWWHLPQHSIATVTTNVPGPRNTLYGLGREVQEILPYVPIASGVRIGVVMFSYRDVLTFGITGDFHNVPDIAVFADGISLSIAELLDEAQPAG